MIYFLTAIVGGISALARKCPRCKRTQLVARSHRKVSVSCKFCGADVPPHKEPRKG